MKTNSYIEMYNHLDRIKIKKEKYLISIVIPVWNEGKTIFSILNSLPNNDKIEIIVIDDYSTDNSVHEIEKVQKNREIKLYKHKGNKGYGKAILTGIKSSNGKIIITMDADGQHCPEDIYTLIQPILDGDADFTIGSRYLGTYNYKLPISTRFGEIIIEKLVHIFFGKKVVNNQGGFRAIDRRIFKIFNDIQFKNYAFTTELIIRAQLYGFRIKECPITLLDRVHGSSRIILNKLAFNLFSCIFRYLIVKIKMKIFNKKDIVFRQHKLIFGEKF